MFKISDEMYDVLTALTRIQGCKGMRDAISVVAKVAQNNEESMDIVEVPEDATRKSVAITEEDKQFFAQMAKKRGVSRDTAFYSCLSFLVEILQKKWALTTEQKIHYANVLLDVQNKMLAVLNSPEAVEAREALAEANDPDFGSYDDRQSCLDCLEKIGLYLTALDLEEFIELKKKELNEKKE